jgi:hypothetical protein
MKELFKNKLIWVVIVLIILNLLSIGMLWCSHMCKGKDKWDGKDRHHKDFLSEKLNFTEAQKTAFHKLRETHFAEIKNNKKKIHELKKELMNLPEDVVASDSSARRISNEIGSIQANMEWSRYEHFKQVYNLCDDSQKKLFKDVLMHIQSKDQWGKGDGRDKWRNCEKGCNK